MPVEGAALIKFDISLLRSSTQLSFECFITLKLREIIFININKRNLQWPGFHRIKHYLFLSNYLQTLRLRKVKESSFTLEEQTLSIV